MTNISSSSLRRRVSIEVDRYDKIDRVARAIQSKQRGEQRDFRIRFSDFAQDRAYKANIQKDLAKNDPETISLSAHGHTNGNHLGYDAKRIPLSQLFAMLKELFPKQKRQYAPKELVLNICHSQEYIMACKGFIESLNLPIERITFHETKTSDGVLYPHKTEGYQIEETPQNFTNSTTRTLNVADIPMPPP